MIDEARILREIPLVASAGKGVRVLAMDAGGTCHLFTRRGDENVVVPEQSFDVGYATGLAEGVLAGDPRTTTAHATLRILAAAVLALGESKL